MCSHLAGRVGCALTAPAGHLCGHQLQLPIPRLHREGCPGSAAIELLLHLLQDSGARQGVLVQHSRFKQLLPSGCIGVAAVLPVHPNRLSNPGSLLWHAWMSESYRPS